MSVGFVVAWLLAVQASDPAAIMREGFALLENNQHDVAVARFEACVAAARQQSHRLAQGECTRGLGRAAQARRDLGVARAFFEAAHESLIAAGDQAALGRNFTDRAFLAYVQAEWAEVREFYTRAAAAYGAAGMKVEQAMALRGSTFAQGMPLEDRYGVLARAAELAREAKNPRAEALILHHWGDMLFVQGQYQDSMEKAQQAVQLLEPAGDAISLARALTSLGRLYRTLGAPRPAVEVYRRVLAIQEKTNDILGQAQTYGAIGTALSSAGSRESIEYFETGLALARKTANVVQINFLLGISAFGFLHAGEHARALAVIDEAIAANVSVDDLAVFHAARSAALRGLKRYGESIAAATTALGYARRLKSAEWETDALINRADAHAATGDLDAARRDLEETTAVIETQRGTLPPFDFLKRGFGDKYQDTLGRTVALVHAGGRQRDALTLSEQARGRALLDLMASRDLPAAAPPPLTMRGAATTEIGSAAMVPAPTGDTVTRVADRLGTTLLSYWINDDAAFVWVTRPDGSTVSRRIGVRRIQLQQLVQRTWSFGAAVLARRGAIDDEPGVGDAASPAGRALAAVTMRGGEPLAPAGLETRAYRELYDLLIQPIRSALPNRAGALLTIVPHGPLFELSFAALLAPNGRHLLEDYRLHYAPSAATLELTARRPPGAAADRRYLFVANPATAPSKPPLPPLPGAEREVAAVSRLVGPSRATLLTGKTASEDAVRSAIGRYRVVHFATHGLVSSDNPFDSYLALAPGADGDGKLTAADIQQLRLSADLVVLSACRSAGGSISGDGIIGLTRAFFTAGTPSILAALWDMADESAEHLLPRFYAEWQKGNDKGKALRAAQLSMLRDLRAGKLTVNTPFGSLPLPAHPALWANLVLIGEPK